MNNLQRLKYSVHINPSRSEVNGFTEDEEVSFLPMDAVSENGEINPTLRKFGEVSKGYTYFRDNDVVMAKITPCFENGKGAVIHGLKNEFGFGTTEFIVMRPTDLDAKYLHYLVSSDRFRKDGENEMRGSAGQKRVPESFVANYRFLKPTIAEQQKCVEKLDKKTNLVNVAITHKLKLIEQLKEKRTAVIHHAVTHGLDENVELVASGVEWIGRIPKNWKINRAKTFIKTRTAGVWGEEPDGGKNDLPCLRVADFDYEHMGYHKVSTIRSIESSQQWRVLPKHSILVERSGGGEKQPVGRAIYFNGNERMVCANFIDVIITKTHVYPKYFAYLLYDAYSIGISRKYIRQSTGIQNLNISGYLNEVFVEPPYETQQKIVERLDCLISAIDLAVEKIVKSIDLLLEYRASLIVQITTRTK